MEHKSPVKIGGTEEVTRVRMPRGREQLGRVHELLGASRFSIICKDGKTRICRIPGRFRRKIKIRMDDVVLMKPWDVEPEEKGDIVWIYNKTHSNWLKEKGYI